MIDRDSEMIDQRTRTARLCVRSLRAPAAILALTLAGCQSKPVAPAPMTVARPASRPATQTVKAEQPLPKVLAPPPRLARRSVSTPKDPVTPPTLGTRLDIYDVTVPAGTVSRDASFWRWIDEDAIDPATADALRRNGVRMGLARLTDWPSVRGVFDALPAKSKLMSTTGRDVRNLELSLGSPVISESLFTFDRAHVMTGRTFDACENLLEVSFAQVPRQPGTVRVTLDPLVRSTRKQLTYSALGNEQSFAFTYPERLLEVNLTAVVPLQNLLVVAPSDEAALPGSIGRAFFVQATPQLVTEHVLVIVPRMFQVEDDSTSSPREAAAKAATP